MPDKVTNRIPEWKLQAAIVADLERQLSEGAPFAYAGSLEGVRLNPFQARVAKATGMQGGEPDLRLYFEAGRLVFVELKGDGGSLKPDQKERIPILRALGFVVHVVFAKSEAEAVALVASIVAAEIALPGSSAQLPSASYWPKARRK